MLGGEDKMRGYYKGALRDHVLVDCQLEYRLPIWNIFGMTAFVGTGRVAESYSDVSPDGFWLPMVWVCVSGWTQNIIPTSGLTGVLALTASMDFILIRRSFLMRLSFQEPTGEGFLLLFPAGN